MVQGEEGPARKFVYYFEGIPLSFSFRITKFVIYYSTLVRIFFLIGTVASQIQVLGPVEPEIRSDIANFLESILRSGLRQRILSLLKASSLCFGFP